MNGIDPAEVYRQRYETYRHLDKLRWQMLQILVALLSGVAFVFHSSETPVEWWFFALIGASLLLLSWLIFRVNLGVRNNQIELKKAAQIIGDEGVPNIGDIWLSANHWIGMAVAALGVILALVAVSRLAHG